jgi:hypothetical protein
MRHQVPAVCFTGDVWAFLVATSMDDKGEGREEG